MTIIRFTVQNNKTELKLRVLLVIILIIIPIVVETRHSKPVCKPSNHINHFNLMCL